MILLKISNSSEIVAAKVGELLERLTPDGVDHSTVEGQVVRKMIESLSQEGLKGQVSIVSGVDVEEEKFVLNQNLKVITQKDF